MGNLCAPAAQEEKLVIPQTAGDYMQQISTVRKSHDVSNGAPYKRNLMNMQQRSIVDARKEMVAQAGVPFDSVYKQLKTIGAGAAAKVVLCEHLQTGAKYAVKLLPKSADLTKQKEGLVKKIAIMKALQQHPNMIKFYSIYEEAEQFCVVLEWCAGGPLFDHLMSKFAHAKGIMHRDLKPENLMLAEKGNETSLRVIDYGTAEFCHEGTWLSDRIGTPYYVAPEVLAQKYNKSADIWSAGVIMYILLCGYPPFSGNAEVTLARVTAGRYTFSGEEWADVTQEAKDMIRSMLTMDIDERATAEKLLEHPWFDVATKTQSLGSRMIGRLRAFVRLNRLKRLAMVVLARSLSDSDVQRIRDEFQGLDDDGASRINMDGLQRVLANLGVQLEQDELLTLFDAADFDHKGNISPEEFIAAVLVSSRMGRQKEKERSTLVHDAFDMLDHDHDGFITPEDLIFVMPQGTTIEEARQMVEEIDTTGKVNYQEFAHLMQPQGLVELLTYHSLLTGVRMEDMRMDRKGALPEKLIRQLTGGTNPALPLTSQLSSDNLQALVKQAMAGRTGGGGMSRSASTQQLAPMTEGVPAPPDGGLSNSLLQQKLSASGLGYARQSSTEEPGGRKVLRGQSSGGLQAMQEGVPVTAAQVKLHVSD